VRNTTAPVQAKVDQVGEQTQKQGQEIQENKTQIKQVDENAQAGISAAKERAMTADNHAGEAMKHAGEAMSRANQVGTELNQRVDQTNSNLDKLRTSVANLDDYKMTGETSVPFRFNKYSLDNQSKEELDKLVANVGNYKRFFISVEGFTDTTGTAAYNEELSRKRADAVAEYLVTKHDIPIYRIHMIGLGKEKPVDMGKNRAARAKNRRVEVRIYSADQGAAVSQVNQPAR
jgi:outer membrane protein OmpA-like peptidoglycan-associated protein